MEKISSVTPLAHNKSKNLTEISSTNTTKGTMFNVELDTLDSMPKLAESSVSVNVPARINLKKSSTCGSLYAKCSCSEHLPAIIPLITETDCDKVRHKLDRHNKKNQSFSHPDTPVIFTEENRYPVSASIDLPNRLRSSITQETVFKTGNQDIEIKHSKRSSSPNLGFAQYSTESNVEIHPEFKVQVIPKTSTQSESAKTTHGKRKAILKKGSKSFPSATRSFRFDSGDRTFSSSYSVDEENEEQELSEKVTDLIVSDLDSGSTSLSSTPTTVVEVYQSNTDEKPLNSPIKLEKITAEKFFQVRKLNEWKIVEACKLKFLSF